MLLILSFVRNNLLLLILTSLFLGLLNGYHQQVSYLRPMILPPLSFMVVTMMINMMLKYMGMVECVKVDIRTGGGLLEVE